MKKIFSSGLISLLILINIASPIQAQDDPFGLENPVLMETQEESLEVSLVSASNYFLMLAGLYATATLDAQLVVQVLFGYTLVNFIGGVSGNSSSIQ